MLPVAAAIVGTSCAPGKTSATPDPQPAVRKEKPEPAPSKKPLLPASERGEVSSVSIDRLFELQQAGTALIYDARPSLFYNQGHIAGAINTPKSVIEDVIKVREPEFKAAKAAGRPIVVYCTGPLCSDARTVARHLASRGYSSSVYTGGWDEWKAAGLPTE